MSISLIGSPDRFSPAFNPIVFFADSTNKTEEGFRYVVDIYSGNSTTVGIENRIARYKVFPRPIDGYGNIDINQVLSTQVSTYFNQVGYDISAAEPDIVRYNIQFGEEFVPYWEYTAITSTLSAGTYYAEYSGATAPPEFPVNSNIYVDPNGFFAGGSLLSGSQFTIGVNIFNPNTVVVDIGSNNILDQITTGTISLFDGSKLITTGLTSFSGYAFNGAVSHQEYNDWDSDDYYIDSQTPQPLGQFLTNVPDYYRVKLDNDMWLHAYGKANYTENLYITTYDINDTVIGQYRITGSTLSGDTIIKTFPTGPNTLSNSPYSTLIGPTSIFSSSTIDYYTVNTERFTTPSIGINTSDKKYFKIDRNCTRYDNIELLFIDRLGSYIPANFELQNIRKINIDRDEYNTLLGGLVGNKFGYDSTSRGRNQFNTSVKEELTLNTNWLTADEADFLKELFTSPRVFIKENDEYWPVVITTNRLDLLTKKNKKNLRYSITVEYANDNIIQNL